MLERILVGTLKCYRYPYLALHLSCQVTRLIHTAPQAAEGQVDMASHTVPLPGGIPPNHKPHTESNTTILLPKAGVFLNPPQQFNRDLSVAVIRAWNERRKEELELRSSRKNRKHKKEKKLNGEVQDSLEHPQSELVSLVL